MLWGEGMTGVEMIKKLKSLGFTVIKVSKSSHYHMVKGNAYVIVPHHHKELGKGLYNQILIDAELK
jgi:predicted RNA binding protein YcfA (HicA-like mRNA interferase family)